MTDSGITDPAITDSGTTDPGITDWGNDTAFTLSAAAD